MISNISCLLGTFSDATADLMSLKKFMSLFVLRMNDDPDTHCEPVSSQQVQKSLKLKGVIRQGFLVKPGSHYQLMSKTAARRTANVTDTPMKNVIV